MKENKEKLGIYNVTFNDKNATPIKSDIELIEDAIINDVIMYVKGWHNEKRDKGLGAKHIKLHLEKNSQGQITHEELLNLGNSLREYLKEFKKPYVENKTNYPSANIYEWQNKNGVRFRAIVTDVAGREGLIPPLSSSSNAIISFYSDRNINQRMEFKNPLVKAHYELIEKEQQILKENKHMENKGQDYER